LQEKEDKRITAKYLGRLGLLTIVNEEETKTSSLSSPLSFGDEVLMSPRDSRKSSDMEDNNERAEYIVEKMEKFNLTKYLEGELEKLLKVKNKMNFWG